MYILLSGTYLLTCPCTLSASLVGSSNPCTFALIRNKVRSAASRLNDPPPPPTPAPPPVPAPLPATSSPFATSSP